MALKTRPAGSYTPTNSITNTTKYQDDSSATPKVAISSAKVDGDINKLFDELTNVSNQLDDVIDPVTELTEVTVAAGDTIVIADASDSNALKRDTIQGIIDLAVAAAVAAISPEETGVVKAFSGTSAPSGYLMCDGAAVSRTTYADLFTICGTTYGAGDGSTTFNLPDLRGRTIFGVDNMGGSAANRVTSGGSGITGTTLGATGGDQLMHQHTHTANVTDPGHSHAMQWSGSGSNGATTGQNSSGTVNISTGSATTGITVVNLNAGSGSSENMPPAIMMNYIVKT